MRVFVSGGTGVIGRRTVKLLTGAGHQVSALSRTESNDELLHSLGAEPVRCDLFDLPGLKQAVAGHDTVVNLATAIPPMDRALKKSAWRMNHRIRTEGSSNMVDAALAAGCGRYIQESITFPYRDSGSEWIDESVPFETTPAMLPPVAAENNAQRFSASGGTGVVLRFGVFYCADSGHTVGSVAMVHKGLSPIIGPPQAYQSQIQVDDAARAVVAALSLAAGVYNVVDDDPLTRAEVTAIMAQAAGRTRLRRIPSWIMRLLGGKDAGPLMRSQRVSNRALKSAGDWRPQHDSFRTSWPDIYREIVASRSAAPVR